METEAAPLIALALTEGETVAVNGYRSNGQTFITSVVVAQQVYLPLVVK